MQEKGCLTPRLHSALTEEGRREEDNRGAQKKKEGKTREMEDSKAHGSESMPGDLSEALKEATKEVHEQAESTEFMKNFQKGQVSLREFKMVMASLYYIYSALEEEIEHNKDHPAFTAVYFPSELHRNAALQQDLEYFYGPSWREEISCPEATQKYVDRLHYVGQHEPELLVAHAYTRYLGDLSGGQVLKKIAQKVLHLPSTGEGLEFFTFEGVSSATKFKQLYRSRMNSIEMDPTMKKRVLEEAKRAFLLNIQVFEELQKLVSQPHENSHPAAQQKPELRTRGTSRTHEHGPVPVKEGEKTSLTHTGMLPSTPLVRWILAFSFLVTTVAVGLFAM
uniref:heme oxygenase (biliverdin-producing) n=1 Tax=Pelodiscus sinensis TaxID=13735 RepID=K7FP07_PELSI|nr:heme oxygenase 1 [Pelodiscus sinensis]|eukprot:XP_006138024.1 heme oxygenase 1 [Pelodiscus sinensis]